MTQAGTTEATPDDPGPRTSRRLRNVLGIVLVLALVGALSWLALGAYQRITSDGGLQSERDAVMLRSQEYVKAAATVGPDDLGKDGTLTAYKERVLPLISTARKPVFEQGLANLAEQIEVQGYSSTTEVNRVGVESLDHDSAAVLVALDQTLVSQGESLGTMAGQWRVKLVRVDGTWLVDSVADVTGGAQ